MAIIKYKVVYHHEIKLDVKKIPKNIKLSIRTAINERLLIDPASYSKPLSRDLTGLRKMKIGHYRVILEIKDTIITILKIGHRSEVYNPPIIRH